MLWRIEQVAVELLLISQFLSSLLLLATSGDFLKTFYQGGSRLNHAHIWVWSRCKHAYVFKDADMIIKFNDDIANN